MKHHVFWGICLVLCATVLRFAYAAHSPSYITTGDSVSYFLTAKHIVETGNLVDPWRTPVYPLLLAVPYVFSGHPMPTEISGVFTSGLMCIRIWQSVFMVIGTLILYVICLKLRLNSFLSAALSFVATADYTLLLLEHAILTEAFSFFWLSIVVYFSVLLFTRFSWRYIAVLTILWIIGMFLRPSVIGLPFLILGASILRYRTRRMLVASIISLILYVGVITVYSRVNLSQSGFSGISRIQDVNMWGKLLHMGISDQDLGDSDTARKARAAMQVHAKHPFEIFRQFPELYKREHAGTFHNFTTGLVRDHLGAYVAHSVTSLPAVVTSPTDIVDKTATTGKYDAFFAVLKLIYQRLVYLSFIPLFGVLFVLYRAIKKSDATLSGVLCITLIGVYHVAVSSLMAYDDFGRLLAVARPLLLVSTVLLIRELKKDI